ncbi:STAS domain-containing protein [Candidatus Uhrbacteria bacterium]|nr:STAS domain-containing protein [Candidatus Uhrbacteria bacterium]
MSKDDPVLVELGARGPMLAARDRVRELLRDAEGAAPVLLDAAGLTFISRTAAAELLDAVRRWRAAGRTVEWRNVGDDIVKMFRAVDPTAEIDRTKDGM